ncbi:MAG: SIMPL domain-containing protein [Bdellovibrionota bacterium]
MTTHSQNRIQTLLSSPSVGLSVAGLALAIALITAASIGAKSFEFTQRSAITVKGFAAKSIVSDLALWEGVVSTRNKDLATAYRKLEADGAQIVALLEKVKISRDQIEFSATRTQILKKKAGYNDTNEIEGYQLEQSFRVQSKNVELVQKIASEATELLKKGIEINSTAPRFYYTELEGLKVDMLAQATRDARSRAETLATNSKTKLGDLRSAQQGVFQITPENSVEVSSYGENDTSSLKKVIRGVVTVEYGLE